jgi:hypothetical protein
MRRRTLFAGAFALAASAASAAGCTNTGPAPGRNARSGAPPATNAPNATNTPPGSGGPGSADPTRAVVLWRLTGGFVGPGIDGIRPPRLAVYPDGRAIADAAYTGQITPAELADLVTHLTKDLRDPAAASPRAGAPNVPDAPDTVMTVRSAAGEFTLTVVALEELRDEHAYGDAVNDAGDRLHAVHKRVVDGGRKYTADRVRVVALGVEPGSQTGTVRPWPAAVPVPPGDGANTRSESLSGAAAHSATMLLDPQWRPYRTTGGLVLSATWRYLLPDE